jgi:uncharacterized protein (DUF934 family)
MRPILKRLDVGSAQERREIVQDDTTVVPLAELKNLREHTGRLGVRLSPADQVEDLGDDLKRVSVVEIEFPSAGEGRGYSQARLLRSARFGFKGELRAVGAGVKQDLLFIMARCGLDAFELAPGQNLEEAVRAFQRYTVAYQPAEPLASIQQQRYHTA